MDNMWREAEENVHLLETYFKELSSFDDVDTAMALQWASLLLITMYKQGMPITHEKFPEVLRATANVLELRFCKKGK
jgi:hypothetical protein